MATKSRGFKLFTDKQWAAAEAPYNSKMAEANRATHEKTVERARIKQSTPASKSKQGGSIGFKSNSPKMKPQRISLSAGKHQNLLRDMEAMSSNPRSKNSGFTKNQLRNFEEIKTEPRASAAMQPKPSAAGDPRNSKGALANKPKVVRPPSNLGKVGNDAMRARANSLVKGAKPSSALQGLKQIASGAMKGAGRGAVLASRVPAPAPARVAAEVIGIAGGLLAGAARAAYDSRAASIQDYIDKVKTGGNQYSKPAPQSTPARRTPRRK